MSKSVPSSLLVALATITLCSSLPAQGRSTANSATLDAIVAARPADSRTVVTAALSSSQAVAVAGRMGISSGELATRIAALDDASAQQLADRILAGGANVVISTTAIIIILLVLILVTH